MAEAHLSKVSEVAWQRIFTFRDNFVEKYGKLGKPFYDYQREASDKISGASLRELRGFAHKVALAQKIFPLHNKSFKKGTLCTKPLADISI